MPAGPSAVHQTRKWQPAGRRPGCDCGRWADRRTLVTQDLFKETSAPFVSSIAASAPTTAITGLHSELLEVFSPYSMASPEATPVKHSGSEAGDSATGTNNVSASAEDAPQIATMNELQTASSTFEQTQPPQSRLLAKRGASGDFSLDGLILFDLTSKPGAHDAFSPHCIKTIVDLRILGVQGFERSRLTFTQIREDLAEKIGHPGVTVPTLELADGSHLTDSWKISEVSKGSQASSVVSADASSIS